LTNTVIWLNFCSVTVDSHLTMAKISGVDTAQFLHSMNVSMKTEPFFLM